MPTKFQLWLTWQRLPLTLFGQKQPFVRRLGDALPFQL
jgi:hypothetical protein